MLSHIDYGKEIPLTIVACINIPLELDILGIYAFGLEYVQGLVVAYEQYGRIHVGDKLVSVS